MVGIGERRKGPGSVHSKAKIFRPSSFTHIGGPTPFRCPVSDLLSKEGRSGARGCKGMVSLAGGGRRSCGACCCCCC